MYSIMNFIDDIVLFPGNLITEQILSVLTSFLPCSNTHMQTGHVDGVHLTVMIILLHTKIMLYTLNTGNFHFSIIPP